MASFRALVLDFVAGYIARWGQSPSYGEIAAGTNSNRTRVKRALVSLERKGLLVRAGGVRGLSLPDEIERARQTLERAGLLPPERPSAGQASSSEAVGLPRQKTPVTKPTLLPPPALDYPARGNQAVEGNRRDGNSGGSGSSGDA